MEGVEERVAKLLDDLNSRPKDEVNSCQYLIDMKELKEICEYFLGYRESSRSNDEYIQRQENYIRLLEKENKELRGEK